MSRAPAGALAAALALLMSACGPAGIEQPTDGDPAAPGGTIRLYTSVTQDTVDAVLDAFAAEHPEVDVEVFRAPTGELDARIAAELREGRLNADVLWGTDPLSVRSYADRGLFRAWTPEEAGAVPAAYQTDTFWGTRILNMIIVHQPGLDPAPSDWWDLADAAYADAVAIPDPGFAGSAFGALGHFATADGYGLDYYRQLRENGTVQLQAIPEVLTGVAEGQYVAGITLDKTARDAIDQGSPVEIAWPSSGAIAIYSPIAVFDDSQTPAAAEALVSFVLSRTGQEAIAGTGWQPIRDDVTGGPPIDGPQVGPDWAELFDRQDELLEEYRSIFGG
jgi:iron(III) transport system substrate-binding protein